MLNIEKGQSISLVKPDGTIIQKIIVGLSWDTAEIGQNVDLDLFVIHKQSQKVAFFNDKTAIKGVLLSDDNLTGEGEGVDEFTRLDATQTDDGDYYICINIHSATSRNQSFNLVKNAKATIYNDAMTHPLANYPISQDGGRNTALIVANVKDSGGKYEFIALGEYIIGDINEVAQAIFNK
jgi:tellurium resistance protein TerD